MIEPEWTGPRCTNCEKPDKRKVPKPLCLDCYKTEVNARNQMPTFRADIRRQMRSERLHEVQLERWLTGRWPIVAPR